MSSRQTRNEKITICDEIARDERCSPKTRHMAEVAAILLTAIERAEKSAGKLDTP